MTKILISSVGSLVGYNILDALEGRRKDLQIIGTNSTESDANIYRCDKAYRVPTTKNNKTGFLNALVEILEIEQPDLIIPGRDDDIGILATIRAKHPKFADKCLSGNENAVRNILDKWLTFKFALKYDLPFAKSAQANSIDQNVELNELLDEYGYPLLVKPRDGFGSHGVFAISNREQLEAAMGLEHMLIQQYLSNPAELDELHKQIKNQGVPLFFSFEEEKFSLQTFVHRDGSVGAIFCTVHKMVSGRSLKVTSISNEELEDIGMRYAKAMSLEGWFGPLNIQCQQLQSGEFVAYELNGRFTGATSARYHLGFDEVGSTLHTLLGVQLDNKDQLAPESDQVSRYVTTRGIPDDGAEKFRELGKWSSF